MGDGALGELLAPVVLISADALLCMSTSTRLSAVLARVRELHRERLQLTLRDRVPESGAEVVELRREGLDRQAEQLIERAERMRRALMLLYGSIVALVGASLALGAAALVEAGRPTFERFGAVGVVAGLLAIGAAATILGLDMRRAVDAARYEHGRIGHL